MVRAFLPLVLLALAIPSRAFDEDDHESGEFIPTGVTITPTAAKGSRFEPLNPDLPSDSAFTAGQAVTTALSPDGRTLLILTSGFNKQNLAAGKSKGDHDPDRSSEYVFVYDVSSPKPVKKQVLRLPNAFDGLAWNPNGSEFYASGGTDDDVHVFVRSAAGWVEDAKSLVALAHGKALGLGKISPGAAGLSISADGKTLAAADYENDSISLIDLRSRKKTGGVDLRPGGGRPGGSYPYWIAIKGNDTAFVSSQRDREIIVVSLSSAPAAVARVALKSQPSRLILNKDQTLLFVAEASGDRVAVINTGTFKVLSEIATTAPKAVFANARGYKGSSPNSLALSPDEKRIYVANGGANSVAVIENDPADSDWRGAKVVGLIPTGWYPNSVSVSADGATLYIVNGKSNAGPNPGNCRSAQANTVKHGAAHDAESECGAANQYVWQLTKAGFLTLPTPRGAELDALTAVVARNNHYVADPDRAVDRKLFSFLRGKIKHVIYVVKENRTYDQILGDLDKGNGDPKIVVYPRRVTPNQHALADEFVDLDNFYDSGETSGDGWNWSTSARAADTVEKTEPVYYAGRGLEYDYEGTNRSINVGLATAKERQAANPLSPDDPDILPGTADVSAPDGPEDEAGAGYLWDSALRAGLTIRNYGFFIDLTRYEPAAGASRIPLLTDPHAASTQVAYATKAALQPVTDPYFRSFDTAFPDYYRVNEWLREFGQYEKDGNLPNLELVRVMEDHTGSFAKAIDGVDTPEIQTADNDYAVGRIVEAVSHSPRYKDNTLIFIVEDDAQDGPDHVDAHRSIAFIAGPYVRRREVVSKKYTTVSMIGTMVDILGIDHLGLNDAQAEPMSDCFEAKARPWSYSPIVPDLLKTTRLPLRWKADGAPIDKPLHDASWWAEKTKGFDFSAEDKVDAALYNRVLWQGIMGDDRPYPAARSGLDLREGREKVPRDASL